MRIGSIVIDCHNVATMMRFWQEALHYVPREAPQPDWVVLMDPGGRGPNVSLNQSTDVPPGRSRLHLDLYTGDQEREVDRLLALGATLHRPRAPDGDFVVLADPEGNLFCVVDKSE